MPSSEGIVSIPVGALKGAESDGAGGGTGGAGESPRKVTMPVFGSTEGKGMEVWRQRRARTNRHHPGRPAKEDPEQADVDERETEYPA